MENPQRNARLGYIKSIPDDMNGLFEKWYKRTENIGKDEKDGNQHYCLVCDGIMRKRGKSEEEIENEWERDEKRIAILIKDENQKEKDGAPWADDTRNWLIPLNTDDTPKKKRQKTRNWNVSSKFLENRGQIVWGIKKAKPVSNLDDLIPNTVIYTHFEDIQKSFREEPFALIECKKQAGKASIDDDVLQEYLDAYRKLLYEELDILQPHIFVCTNERIYKFVQEYLTKDGTQITHVPSLEKVGEYEASVTLHLPSKSVILCSYHPSARMSYEDFYDGVLKHYYAFVQSPYYEEFFK